MPLASPINKHMRVLDIITLCPESESVIAEYGLHCFNCSANAEETLIDGCRTHGFEDDEVDELVDDINQIIHDLPSKPEVLTLTTPAAHAIRDIAEAEGRLGEGLAVIADGRGGFCLEFQQELSNDDRTFHNSDVPDVKLYASSLTLKRVGGSTIDFREGKFKLDLDEEMTARGCACHGNCDCKPKNALNT